MTISPYFLEGSGGGAQPTGPEVESDSLESLAYANVLFLIAEGELEGFPTNDFARHIYFDDVPVERPNGTRNFKGVTFKWRSGTLGQSHIPGFGEIQSEESVNSIVRRGQPVVESITNPDADWAKIRIMLPALQKQEDDGDVKGTSVQFRIEVASAGQPFQQRLNPTLKGKASEPVQFDYRVRLRGNAPWQIRVSRLTDDSNSQQLQNDLNWQALTTIVDAKLRYPGSALLGCRFDSRLVRPSFRVAVELKGERIMVPSNYNPVTRTYTGIWNGTFQKAYTTNPAWIYYDLLTNERSGCGEWIDASQVDIWGLYSIAQYCDELVPNGKGGMEPRYQCNIYIENQEEAYTLLNSIASIFRGMAYWARGSIITTADKPADPVRLYTEANVVEEIDEETGEITKPPFVYSGSSAKTRHTVAWVEWSDPNDAYKTKLEPWIDREALAIYGYRATKVVAVGCTSQGQARRVGKWLIYSEQQEEETLTFSVGSEGMLAQIGEVIKIADPMRSLSRWAGRLVATTPGPLWVLTLDAPVETGHTGYTISLMRSNGQQMEISATLINSTTVSVVGLPEPPMPGTVWILASTQVQPQLFRVLMTAEDGPHRYEITAIAHNPSKYAAIEADEPLREHNITSLQNINLPPEAPGNVQAEESIDVSGGEGLPRVTVSWDAVAHPFVNRYLVEWRSPLDEAWTQAGTTTDTTLDILDPALATYEIRVTAITINNVLGDSSEPIVVSVLNSVWLTEVGNLVWLTEDGSEPWLLEQA